MPRKISCCVVCFNEKLAIPDCLKSVRWCDEVVVVDAFSNDGTLEICRQHADRVIQRRWEGYINQKAFAVDQASHEWVLYLDADERVTAELRGEMNSALELWGESIDGFRMPRLVFYLDRWWRRGGWYPDYRIRLFKKSRVVWAGRDPHDRILVNGKTRTLRNPLVHMTYRNVSHHVEKINRLTDVAAREMFLEKERWSWRKAIFHPMARFFKFFFLKRGVMEGRRGFFVAWTAAAYVFLKYAKLSELERAGRVRDPELDE